MPATGAGLRLRHRPTCCCRAPGAAAAATETQRICREPPAARLAARPCPPPPPNPCRCHEAWTFRCLRAQAEAPEGRRGLRQRSARSAKVGCWVQAPRSRPFPACRSRRLAPPAAAQSRCTAPAAWIPGSGRACTARAGRTRHVAGALLGRQILQSVLQRRLRIGRVPVQCTARLPRLLRRRARIGRLLGSVSMPAGAAAALAEAAAAGCGGHLEAAARNAGDERHRAEGSRCRALRRAGAGMPYSVLRRAVLLRLGRYCCQLGVRQLLARCLELINCEGQLRVVGRRADAGAAARQVDPGVGRRRRRRRCLLLPVLLLAKQPAWQAQDQRRRRVQRRGEQPVGGLLRGASRGRALQLASYGDWATRDGAPLRICAATSPSIPSRSTRRAPAQHSARPVPANRPAASQHVRRRMQQHGSRPASAQHPGGSPCSRHPRGRSSPPTWRGSCAPGAPRPAGTSAACWSASAGAGMPPRGGTWRTWAPPAGRRTRPGT